MSVDIRSYLTHHKTQVQNCHKKDMSLKYVNVDDYAKLKPLQYTLATEKSMLETFIGGKKEVKTKVNPGNFVICGIKKELYTVTPQKMKTLYHFGDITTISQPRKCLKVTKKNLQKVYNKNSIRFEPPWGGEMLAENGDYLILSDNGAYRVEKNAFKKTYQLQKTQKQKQKRIRQNN